MQTSSKVLPVGEKNRLTNLFATLLADLNHPRQVNTFLDDFFTDTEKIVFLKRLGIIDGLEKGWSYEEISTKLSVSSATISSIAELKKTKGIRLVLEKLKADAWAEKIAQRLRKTIFF